jgi:hypothetical protein
VALGEADVKDATSFDTLAQASEPPGADDGELATDELAPLAVEMGIVAGAVVAGMDSVVAGYDSVV